MEGRVSGRPVIGVCAALERARWAVWDMPAALVGDMYLAAIRDAGGMAVLLPPDPALAGAPDEALDLVDGLLLVGGADVEAARYGERPHASAEPPQRVRDAVEIALVRRAHARGVPVLGVCRGAQVINVALGGTLWQHLPETHGGDDHRRTVGRFEGNDHTVLLTPGSRAAAAAGERRHRVLSHHHQGIRDVGEGLLASGFADDGVVETVESAPSAPWMLGVQWHPEADPASPVIAALVRAAAEARARGR